MLRMLTMREFERNGRARNVDVVGPLTLNDDQLMVLAASEGLGIACVSERLVSSELKAGRLAVVLSEWCPRIPGLALYYSGHRQVPAGLRAFIDILKEMQEAGTTE
jgi:DNA-binding transcriptional LysR family regulator